MRPHRLSTSFWIINLGLLLLYGWTLTESTAATIRVADGQCTAELYGRTSTIACPGLTGSSLATFVSRSEEPEIARGRGPLNRLVADTDWDRLKLIGADGQSLAPTAALPAAFELHGRLRRPNDPGGLVFVRPGSDAGWVFIVDGQTRRGGWWEWAGGKPTRPLQGIPLDKPLLAQAQSFIRLVLDAWQGMILLLLAAWAVLLAIPNFATRIYLPVTGRVVRFILAILAFLAFTISLHVSLDVLEGIPHVQDSVTYLFQAQTLAGGELTAPAPPLAKSDKSAHFNQEFLLVRDGRWFGKYPPGFPVVLALGVVLHAHWLVNPLLSALTIPLLYALGRALNAAGRQSPATAGDLLPPLLLAASPFFLIMSGNLMAHAAELFWITLFMLAYITALGSGRWQWAVVAGVAIGMLFLTRQFTALTIGLVFGLAWPATSRLPRHLKQASESHRRPLPPATSLGSRLLIVILAACPFFLLLFGYQAAVTGNFLTDPRLLYWPYDRVGFGPGIGEPGNSFIYVMSDAGPAIQWSETPSQPPRGHTPARGLYNLGRNLSALEDILFGWPALFSLVFIWLAFLLRRPSAADWVLLLVILAIAGGYIAYWAAGIAYGPRYLYAAMPALVILTGRGIRALAAAVGERFTVLVLLVLISFGLIRLPARIESYRAYNFVSAAPRATVEAAVEKPALVFVTASETDWWEYGAFFSGNTPRLNGQVIFARDLGPAENARLRAALPDRTAYLWRDEQAHPLLAP